MLTITNPQPNRINITIDGRITAEDMRIGLDQFITFAETCEDGVVFYDIPDFAMPDLSALGVKFGQLPKLFGLMGRFKRMALVSDASWIRTGAAIEGAMIPGLDIKGFIPEDRDTAETWLTTSIETA